MIIYYDLNPKCCKLFYDQVVKWLKKNNYISFKNMPNLGRKPILNEKLCYVMQGNVILVVHIYIHNDFQPFSIIIICMVYVTSKS
jgi:hypothetical protein